MDTTVRSTPVSDSSRCAVSWSAIIAGALVAFSLSVLFNLLNTGLGLVTFPESFRALATLTIAGYLWLIICGIVAMFLAGFVAGKVYRHYSASPCGGGLHGFLAWSLALLLSVIIASHFASASAQSAAVANQSTHTDMAIRIGDRSLAEQRAEQAADILGGATLGIFFIFLIGAAAATAGGHFAAKKDHHRIP
jgi:uncharacterized integral membrane protein